MKHYVYCFLTFLFLSACAGNQADFDYDPAADFRAFESFARFESADEATIQSTTATPLVHQRIRNAIEAALISKGLRQVEFAQADLLFNYHLSVADAGHSGGAVSIGVGRSSGGYGSRSSVGISGSVPVGGRTVQEGTILIELIDANSSAAIWQGSSSRKLLQNASPGEQQALIDEVVNEILINFPPNQAEVTN